MPFIDAFVVGKYILVAFLNLSSYYKDHDTMVRDAFIGTSISSYNVVNQKNLRGTP